MKRLIALYVLLACFAVVLVGCVSADALKQTAGQLQASNQPALEAIAAIDAQLATLRATTQPTSTPQAIASEAAAEKPLVSARDTIERTRAASQALAPIILTAANGDNPGPAITSAAPMAGPYGTWVALSGIVIGLGWGVWNNIQKGKALAAGQANVDAINAAIANGHLAVTSASAAAAVDAVVLAHPIGDRLVDAIAGAPIATV